MIAQCDSFQITKGTLGMNKAQLVEHISGTVDMSKAGVQRVLDELFNTVGNVVKEGDDVNIAGFGTFTAKMRGARMGRNPQTGQQIEIPAKRAFAFKPGKPLKDKVAG
jgi:DNA-binding protein HU-beta